MLVNILMRLLVVVAVVFIAKKEYDVIRRIAGKEELGWKRDFVTFWAKLFANPIRTVAFGVILLAQDGLVGVVITIGILTMISIYLALQGFLKLDWTDGRVQTIATAATLFVALFWVVSAFDFAEVFLKVIEITGIVIAVIAVVYVIVNSIKEK